MNPGSLDPDHVVGITYTGGTTGEPKGVIGTASSISAMTQIQLAEWEWPEAPSFLICTPLSHAGAALLAETADRVGLTGELSRALAGEQFMDYEVLQIRPDGEPRRYGPVPAVGEHSDKIRAEFKR